ncbi:DUF4880 domain-containing protein [Ectopseudomonas hydrolytica]|uniref:DUF4880 domain-containing protein n=1 Tax=Ectopseudomonas hydrolytica TaxID=2493633 RepID=A0ABY5A215_9GAMM|nr:DUF4880 domain-containing protein [Pseudomonas hydrolytica]OCX15314.1 hypothetical protein BBI09_16180 [Stutzerimonas xanthomarina]USR37640.1 DUF4880 domain-containing protein [Pseudomonas hydrolytica]
MFRRASPKEAIVKQAARWYVLLRDEDATEEDRQAWARWLAQSDQHREVWSSMEQMVQSFAPLQGDGKRELAVRVLRDVHSRHMGRRKALIAIGVVVATAAGGLGLAVNQKNR